MRILFIIDCLGSGGAQRQMTNLALGLLCRGHEVEFYIYYPEYNHFAPILQQANIPIHYKRKQGRFSYRVVFDIRNQLSSKAYDLVLSFLDTPNLYAELARLGKRRPVLVVSERNSYLTGRPTSIKWLLEQFHHFAHHITVNSYYQSQCMLETHPWMRGRLSVIYNGVDLQYFRPLNNAEKFNRTFLSVGSITPRKNVVGLIQALIEYRKQFGDPPTVHWVGAVQPSQSSRDEYRRACALLEMNDLTSHWIWMGERTDVHALYGCYSGLIHPSFREGLPNVICEAMACGIPVLASNICENPRLIKQDVTGLLFDPNSSMSIATVMNNFLQMEIDQRFGMGLLARQFAEDVFSMTTYVDKYESLFDNAMRCLFLLS